MGSLSDLFFYLYFIDLHTLDLVIREAQRIRAERHKYPEFEASGRDATQATVALRS